MAFHRAGAWVAATALAAYGVGRQGYYHGAEYLNRPFLGRSWDAADRDAGLGLGLDASGLGAIGNGSSAAGDGGLASAAAAARFPPLVLAGGAPVVLDGRGTALPAVAKYPVTEPISITAWVLVYSQPVLQESSSSNASDAASPGGRLHAPPPAETALLSFGRPLPYPPYAPDASGNGTATAAAAALAVTSPAPSLHLSVGADPAYRGHLFFGAAADSLGRLTGFFSRKPLPLNEWVHVGLVLEPPSPPPAWGQSSAKPPQATVAGYVNGELQGRLAVDVTRLPAYDGLPSDDGGDDGGDDGHDHHHRAVFVWGGVRSRGGAMLTGLLQHARLHAGRAFAQADVREAMSAFFPWTVPAPVAKGLGLALASTNSSSSSSSDSDGYSSSSANDTASSFPLSAEAKDALATEWLEAAVALLQGRGEGEGEGGGGHEDEEPRRLAHWYLSGAVLLGGAEASGNATWDVLHAGDTTNSSSSSTSTSTSTSDEAATDGTDLTSTAEADGDELEPEAEARAGEEEGAAAPSSLQDHRLPQLWRPLQEALLWLRTKGTSKQLSWARWALHPTEEEETGDKREQQESAPSRLILPPGTASRLAQLILAAQAVHGLDAEGSDPQRQQRERRPHRNTALDRAFLLEYGRGVLAAGTASGSGSSNGMGADRQSQVLFYEHDCPVAVAQYLSVAAWAVDHFGAQIGDGGGGGRDGDARTVPRLVVKQGEETLVEGRPRRHPSPSSSFSSSWPFALGPSGHEAEELEWMRARAEDGQDPDALVWYAQALYWGRNGLAPDRAAAHRYMQRAADLGHPEGQYNAGIMWLQGDGVPGPDPARAEELVGRAAEQGFAPAMAAKGLWTIQKQVPAQAGEGGSGHEAPAAEAAGPTSHPQANSSSEAYRRGEELLRRAAAEGNNPEAHMALAGLKGWTRVGMGSLQIAGASGASGSSNGSSAVDQEQQLWAIARHLTKAANAGHARARFGLATALWDPVLSFDVTGPAEAPKGAGGGGGGGGDDDDADELAGVLAAIEELLDSVAKDRRDRSKGAIKVSSAHRLFLRRSGLGRRGLELKSLRRSCPAALALLRPVAEMAVAGVAKHALESFDAGDDASALRLYGLLAEAGLVVAQVNAEALLDAFISAHDGDDGQEEEEEQLLQERYRHQRMRHRQQLALQGWAPALRELGWEAESRGDVLEAVALYHLAGIVRHDSRALYDLAALLETQAEGLEEHFASLSSSWTRLALNYYRESVRAAGSGPHRVPPFLAYLLLWLRSEAWQAAKRRAVACLGMGWLLEEALLWLAVALLGRVVRLLLAARRRRDQRHRQREPQQQQQQPQEVQGRQAALSAPPAPLAAPEAPPAGAVEWPQLAAAAVAPPVAPPVVAAAAGSVASTADPMPSSQQEEKGEEGCSSPAGHVPVPTAAAGAAAATVASPPDAAAPAGGVAAAAAASASAERRWRQGEGDLEAHESM